MLYGVPCRLRHAFLRGHSTKQIPCILTMVATKYSLITSRKQGSTTTCLCIHPSADLRQIHKHASPYHFVARRRSHNNPVVRFTQVLWSQAGIERLNHALPLVADSGHHQVEHKQLMRKSKSKRHGHRYFNSLYNDDLERLQAGCGEHIENSILPFGTSNPR